MPNAHLNVPSSPRVPRTEEVLWLFQVERLKQHLPFVRVFMTSSGNLVKGASWFGRQAGAPWCSKATVWKEKQKEGAD